MGAAAGDPMTARPVIIACRPRGSTLTVPPPPLGARNAQLQADGDVHLVHVNGRPHATRHVLVSMQGRP